MYRLNVSYSTVQSTSLFWYHWRYGSWAVPGKSSDTHFICESQHSDQWLRISTRPFVLFFFFFPTTCVQPGSCCCWMWKVWRESKWQVVIEVTTTGTLHYRLNGSNKRSFPWDWHPLPALSPSLIFSLSISSRASNWWHGATGSPASQLRVFDHLWLIWVAYVPPLPPADMVEELMLALAKS